MSGFLLDLASPSENLDGTTESGGQRRNEKDLNLNGRISGSGANEKLVALSQTSNDSNVASQCSSKDD